ncbi:hypothetical protein PATSB16_08650 [Pandoraea thiooxydans]|nr:hypothetical protein PATSB16_08650 [Pandoraea thiooxydans]
MQKAGQWLWETALINDADKWCRETAKPPAGAGGQPRNIRDLPAAFMMRRTIRGATP